MIIKNLGKNFFINSSLVILIFLLDRISKIYVINLDKKFPGSEIFASKYLNINLIWNEGIAFGFLSFDQENLYNFLTILITLIIFFILIVTFKSDGLKKLALIMILGGAVGNVFHVNRFDDDEFKRLNITEGLLAVWPSFLDHFVEPSKTDEERISISFDLYAQ